MAGSVAHRGFRGTVARVAQEFQPRIESKTGWQLEPIEQAFAPFAVPVSDTPKVTVIVPTYGKLDYTIACMRSIAKHGALAPFEVIVVDDASQEPGLQKLSQIAGLQVLRNKENLGFIGSCNAAAAMARGSHLLFLNNDTQVTTGWLDRLLDCFEDPQTGAAGSRLAYPDGRLQEAGAIVYADAEAWNYGRFEDPDDPRFLYRRDADYLSGASLMVEARLFQDIGGFNASYAPAYCEDMDLAFAVRAAGRRVIYQPASLVIHYEGISSGLDPFTGIKQYQLINRKKFIDRWKSELKHQPAPGTPAERAVHHAGSRHILVVDALMPDPTRDSGSLRMVNIMRLLADMGWRVTFMPDNRQASPQQIEALGQLGIQTLCKPWSPSLARWLKKQQPGTLDAVMLCRHYVADPNIALVRRLAPQAWIIFDTVDLHFLREQRAAELTGNDAMVRQALASRERELAIIHASDATFVVSPVEQAMLAQQVPEARVELLSNIHDVHGRATGYEERRDLVFVGGFGHPPNEDAVRWLTADIFPRIRASRNDIQLHLIGDMPDTAQSQYRGDGVIIHGRVPDLEPWMTGCRISLAPLRYGAGVKGKVNMAMSHGLPVVGTSIAAEGMMLTNDKDILMADNTDDFVAAILRLYDDPALWYRLSDAGLDNIRRYFSFDAARHALTRVLGTGAPSRPASLHTAV